MIAALALAAVLGQAGNPPVRGPESKHEGRTDAAALAYPTQTRVQKPQVRLGEPFAYEIEVRHPAELSLSLPAELPRGPFHLEPGRCRSELLEGDVVTTCALSATLFALGPQDLPAIALAVTGPEGASTLEVPGPAVTGEGVLDPAAPADQLVLRDLAPPAPLLVRSLRLVWWTLGALAALATALLAWRAWERQRTRAVEPPPPVPAHERFARRLAALEGDRLGERGHAREHFYRLSEILREYLGAVLGVPALDLTTEELVDRVRASGDPRLDPEALQPFLEDVDLVKFARAQASPGECASAIAWARALLERTRPPEPPAPAPVGETRA